MISRYPFRIEQCSIRTGAACGVIYLDHGFETLLRKKFEGIGGRPLDEKRLAFPLSQFNAIKRQFDPYDPLVDTEFEILIGSIEDIPQINLEDGYLRLSK